MIKPGLGIVAGILLLAGCASSNVDDDVASNNNSQDEVICKSEIATGSRFTLEDCMSKRDRDRRSARMAQATRDMVQRTYTSPITQ